MWEKSCLLGTLKGTALTLAIETCQETFKT